MAKEKIKNVNEFRTKYSKEIVSAEVLTRTADQVLSTGSLRLDLRLRGGFRAGTISELSGKEGSGKSTIALSTAAQVLKNGGSVLYIDLEYSLDGGTDYGKAGKVKSWLQTLGISIDDDNFVVIRPVTGEEVYEIVEEAVRESLFDLIVLDSLAAMMPKSEVESKQERAFGGAAKLHSMHLRRILQAFGQQSPLKTHIIMINQIRDNVQQGPGYGPKTTTSGGHAVRHYARTRLFIKSQKHEDTGTTMATIRVMKNAFSPPYEECRIFINGKYGIDIIQEIVKFGVQAGFVGKSGSWFTLYDLETGEEKLKAQGMNKLRDALLEEQEYVQLLKEHIWKEGIQAILSEDYDKTDLESA